jgi:cytochrome P450
MLAKNPEYQQRLREEVQQYVGYGALKDPNANLAATLESLPWLNAVCNETLRLWPSVPVTLRTAVNDTSIGGHAISKGTEFVVSIWWTNRLPELWGPRAADFYPERWIDLDEKSANGMGKPNHHGGAQSNYALLTFLHGPRSCIGQNFAKAELRALAAAWMLNYEFEMAKPKEEVVPFGLVTVKPKDGLLLKVKPVMPSA